MAKTIRVRDLNGKKLLNKEESGGLRGNIVILDPENSEIAKRLKVNEKGVYSIKN